MTDLLLHLAVSFVVRDMNVFVGSSFIHQSIHSSCIFWGVFWALAAQSELAEETPALVEFPF